MDRSKLAVLAMHIHNVAAAITELDQNEVQTTREEVMHGLWETDLLDDEEIDALKEIYKTKIFQKTGARTCHTH